MMAAHDHDVKQFGATGDGQTDDTAAIQRALDAAGKAGGTVFLPPGIYASGMLTVPSEVTLQAAPTWAYRRPGHTVLRLRDPRATCLLNLTGSIGARIIGLSLDGASLGAGITGIDFDGADHTEEDSVIIERTRVSGFTGDGIRLLNAWEFVVRQCLVIFNRGDGLAFTRWDGFVLDNMFAGNEGVGIHALAPNASVTITANRVEWNHKGGIRIESGGHYNITGNYIDRSGAAAICLAGTKERPCGRCAITGNILYRSGARVTPDSEDSCHVRMENVRGVTFCGNSLSIGRDDGGKGIFSPALGIVYRGLRDTVIKDNVLFDAALHELLRDGGDNDASVICRDNPGRIYMPPASA